MMTKKIRLEDLCCANCAAKIETKVAALDGVESCTVNYLAEKMFLTVPDEAAFAALKPEIEKIVKKIEPDVIISYT